MILRPDSCIYIVESQRLFGGLEEIANAIPGLNKFSSAFKDASKAARDVAMDNEVNARIEDDIYGAKLNQRKLAYLSVVMVVILMNSRKSARSMDHLI